MLFFIFFILFFIYLFFNFNINNPRCNPLFLGTESCSTISQFISLTYLVEISDLGHSIKTATNTAIKQQENPPFFK